jgi:hypothetical protein
MVQRLALLTPDQIAALPPSDRAALIELVSNYVIYAGWLFDSYFRDDSLDWSKWPSVFACMLDVENILFAFHKNQPMSKKTRARKRLSTIFNTDHR